MPYTYEYPRPALTVDIIVFAKEINNLFILLIQRDKSPFEGMWAFPGGFVDIDETLEDAANRELKEETDITEIKLKQFYTFGDIRRDPRHRTITVVYYGFAESKKNFITPADDARNAEWYNVKKLPVLAFDHADILKKLLKELFLIST